MATHYIGSPEETASLDLFIKLARAQDSLLLPVARLFSEHGLSPSQFEVLDALYHRGPLPPSQLARTNVCSPNNMTSVVDTMERNGLVVRERCARDRRLMVVRLTDRGQAEFEQIYPRHAELVVSMMTRLDPEERMALDGLITKLDSVVTDGTAGRR